MKKINKFIIAFLFFFLFSSEVFAASGTYYAEGTSMYVGNSTDLTLALTNVSGSIIASGGNIVVNDSSCIRITKLQSIDSNININGNKFAYFNTSGNGITSYTNLVKITIQGLRECSSSITITEPVVTDFGGNNTAGVQIGNINVKPMPNGNNNLSSISVSVGSINPSFSPDQTNYNVVVEANVDAINVSANVQDYRSSVSGLGTKYLNYGNNTIYLTVTSESGSKKTYTINVNRRDNRNNDNYLSNLSIDGTKISPAFNIDELNYTATIPFENTNLNIKATPRNNKASVKIENGGSLNPEEKRVVQVVVTAENGSSRTYNLTLTKEKDPNKVLSTDNDLIKLEPSVGMLSPVFDKDVTNYVIWLPYETDKIEFNTELSDKTYGQLEIIGDNQLNVGDNAFKFNVKAENNKVKSYVVIVKRASLYNKTDIKSSKYLSKLSIENSLLLDNFNKIKNTYHYIKTGNLKLNYVSEYENATVIRVDDGNDIYLIVNSLDGEYNVYHLIGYSLISVIIFSIILLAIIIGLIILFTAKKEKPNFIDKIKKIIDRV